jgi:hypothetical protein
MTASYGSLVSIENDPKWTWRTCVHDHLICLCEKRQLGGEAEPAWCDRSGTRSLPDEGIVCPENRAGKDHYSARKMRHSPGTPRSFREPTRLKRRPDPATRSLTVLDTSTSPASASAATRAPICTAMPPTSSPIVSHSPQCIAHETFLHGSGPRQSS